MRGEHITLWLQTVPKITATGLAIHLTDMQSRTADSIDACFHHLRGTVELDITHASAQVKVGVKLRL